MRSILVGLITASLIGGIPADYALAQEPDRRERRRELMEGILRTLVESQLQGRPDQRPGQRRPGPISPQLREAHRYASGFSDEAGRLISALRQEEVYSPAVRPLLGDALKVKATADVLAKHSQLVHDDRAYASAFRPLDQQWRMLSYRLNQYPDLAAPCQAHVRNLDRYDRQLCKLLDVEPQLDRQELMRQLTTLSADIQNLLEDITMDVRQSKHRSQLLMDGRRLLLLAQELAQMVANGAKYDLVVDGHKQFTEFWRRYSLQLRPIDSRYLGRDARRIEQRQRELQELLWIPYAVDRERITYCVGKLNEDVAELLAATSLQTLISLPDCAELVTSAHDFVRLCGDFGESVRGGADIDGLVWDYRVVDVEWQDFHERMRACRDAGVQRQLAVIETDIVRLRESLGVQPEGDYEDALRLAASADNLSALLHREMAQRIGNSRRYAPQYREQAVASARRFHDAAHQFHTNVSQKLGTIRLREDCVGLCEEWERLRSHLGKCIGDDKLALAQTSQRLVPVMAKLQLLYAY